MILSMNRCSVSRGGIVLFEVKWICSSVNSESPDSCIIAQVKSCWSEVVSHSVLIFSFNLLLLQIYCN